VNSRPADWLVNQLPFGMTEDDFLVRFVRIFQSVSDTVMQNVDNVPHLFDTAVTPDVMVRTLGAWLGLDWVDPSLPDKLQRQIVREYSAGLLWRGTKPGLTRLLEVICGAPAIVEDTGGIYADGNVPEVQPHVRIQVPSSGWTTERDLLRIVTSEMPAHVTFELIVGGRTIHPPSTALPPPELPPSPFPGVP